MDSSGIGCTKMPSIRWNIGETALFKPASFFFLLIGMLCLSPQNIGTREERNKQLWQPFVFYFGTCLNTYSECWCKINKYTSVWLSHFSRKKKFLVWVNMPAFANLEGQMDHHWEFRSTTLCLKWKYWHKLQMLQYGGELLRAIKEFNSKDPGIFIPWESKTLLCSRNAPEGCGVEAICLRIPQKNPSLSIKSYTCLWIHIAPETPNKYKYRSCGEHHTPNPLGIHCLQ